MLTTPHAAPAARARQIAPVLKALSDENRLTILLAVADRESSVTELFYPRPGEAEPLELPDAIDRSSIAPSVPTSQSPA